MLVKPLPESEEEGHDNQEAHQKYETMQCFAVSQPKSIKEEGEGRGHFSYVSVMYSCATSFTLNNLKLEAAQRKIQRQFLCSFHLLNNSCAQFNYQVFKTALSNRIFCDNGSVLYLQRPAQPLLATGSC